MVSRAQAERALILYIGDELTQASENVVSSTGLEGKVSALRSLSDKTIMERANVRDNQAVQQLMKNLLDDGIITTGARPVETYGSSIYFVVQLTNAGWETYAAEKATFVELLERLFFPCSETIASVANTLGTRAGETAARNEPPPLTRYTTVETAPATNSVAHHRKKAEALLIRGAER